MLLWPELDAAKSAGSVKVFQDFHTQHHGSKNGQSKKAHLTEKQIDYYSNPPLFWTEELAHMAWIGGICEDRDGFEYVLQGRFQKRESMLGWLPKLIVGVGWKRANTYRSWSLYPISLHFVTGYTSRTRYRLK